MAWESKHGDVSLFANDRKTKDTHPDWRGKIHIEGVDYEIALWQKTSKTGTKFLSGRMGEEVKAKPEMAWGNRKPNNAIEEAYGLPPEKNASVKTALDSDLPW
jgi:uncharacterized protein (DUF736 family)